jgi:hypothetical protein
MNTRRFNWLVLLVGGMICVAVGILGIAAGQEEAAVEWLELGCAFGIGSVVLWRMHLP